MKLYRKNNLVEEKNMQQSQMLSSLVLNTPYEMDGYTTSPRIAKVFSFPFGLRIDSTLLARTSFNCLCSISLIMVISSLFLTTVYLPIQRQNIELSNSTKSLTNKNLGLTVRLQEASSYNILFSNAKAFSLCDSKEVIQVHNTIPKQLITQGSNNVVLNNYPSIQFAGF